MKPSKEGGRIAGDGILLSCAVLDGSVRVRRVLPFCWMRVPELGEGLGSIVWHGEMDLPAVVVPVELDANVLFVAKGHHYISKRVCTYVCM